MTNNYLFFLGNLRVSTGEFSFDVHRVVVATSLERAQDVLDKDAKEYRNGSGTDGRYFSDGGEVLTQADALNAITYDTFCDLSTKLPLVLDEGVSLKDIEESQNSSKYSIELAPGLYDVEICRVSYGIRTIQVNAESANAAEEKAQDIAGNFTFNEHNAEYLTNSVVKAN